MYDYVRTYRTARMFFTALELVCAIFIAICGIGVIVGLTQLDDRYMGPTPGIFLISISLFGGFLGFVGIAMTQVSRAVVDNAESSREMLEIARTQSIGKSTGSTNALTVIDASSVAGEPPSDVGGTFASSRVLVMAYSAHQIFQEGWVYLTPKIDKTFESLLAVQTAINDFDNP